MFTFTGKQLHALMLANQRSLTISAKKLGIAVDTLQSYFKYESLEEAVILNIIDTLKLVNVVEVPGAITTEDLRLLDIYERVMKTDKMMLDIFSGKVEEAYKIIKIKLPKLCAAKGLDADYGIVQNKIQSFIEKEKIDGDNIEKVRLNFSLMPVHNIPRAFTAESISLWLTYHNSKEKKKERFQFLLKKIETIYSTLEKELPKFYERHSLRANFNALSECLHNF